MTRLGREDIHMLTAYLWSLRSTCKRPDSKVGCVITTSDMREVLSIGYNGSAQQLSNDSCTNTQGSCGCLHAEQNALVKVNGKTPRKIMFITHHPCLVCSRLISQANISLVYYNAMYRNADGAAHLKACGIKLIQMHPNCIMDLVYPHGKFSIGRVE